MRILIIILSIALLTGCEEENTNTHTSIPFEDYIEQLDNPVIAQQNMAIQENGIRICTIVSFDLLSDDSDIPTSTSKTYYNEKGQADSTIIKGDENLKILNEYNSKGLIIKRQSIREIDEEFVDWMINGMIEEGGMSVDSNSFDKVVLISEYEYNNQDQIVLEKQTNASDNFHYEISYEYDGTLLNKIVWDDWNLTITHTFNYESGKIIERKKETTIDSIETRTDLICQYIYQNSKLIKIKVSSPGFAGGEGGGDMEGFYKIEYNSDGKVKKFNEHTWWDHTFKYLENGLIKEGGEGSDGKNYRLHKYSYE